MSFRLVPFTSEQELRRFLLGASSLRPLCMCTGHVANSLIVLFEEETMSTTPPFDPTHIDPDEPRDDEEEEEEEDKKKPPEPEPDKAAKRAAAKAPKKKAHAKVSGRKTQKAVRRR